MHKSYENTMPTSVLIWAVASTACLLGIGIGVGWTAAVVTVVVGTLVWLGYQFAHEKLSVDRLRVERERKALDAEWQALDRTRRIRDTFFSARIAMREEARRYWPVDGPDRRGQ